MGPTDTGYFSPRPDQTGGSMASQDDLLGSMGLRQKRIQGLRYVVRFVMCRDNYAESHQSKKCCLRRK